MRKLTVLTFAAAMGFSTVAYAQPNRVNVDLSQISADLAAQYGIDLDDVPTTIDLPTKLAAEVCGIDAGSLGDSCEAVTLTDDLEEAIEDELDDNGRDNSARDLAPGQQDGPARDAAPGQQDGPAKDSAPGQQKKDK